MNWQQNRLFIGAGALIALSALAYYLVHSRTGDTVSSPIEPPTLPAIDEDEVTALDITRPPPSGTGEPEHVRLELHDTVWRVAQPIDALADASALDTALDKLDELEVAGVAATHPGHHAELEVDDAHGVHVRVLGANDSVIADLIIGAFRGGNTMVRQAGQDTVVTVRGSIRFAFARDLKDWRNRAVLDLEADQVRLAEWSGPHGTFRFQRPLVTPPAPPPPAEGAEAVDAGPQTPTLGDWAPLEVSYLPVADGDAGVAPGTAPLTALENFAASRVTSTISSLAHMRAADFAGPTIDHAGAGITEASARVMLTTGEGSTLQRFTVVVGGEASSGNFYAMREGDPTIFIISSFLRDKIDVTSSAFEQTAAAAAPPSDEPPGGGGEIPPDLMRQIQAQLQAQGLGQ
jgi:hypothetical protein